MDRYDGWTITEDAKAALRAIDDNSFLSMPSQTLQGMRRHLRRSIFNNANEQFGLNQAISAIGDELDSRYRRRTDRWLLVLGSLTLLASIPTLIKEFWPSTPTLAPASPKQPAEPRAQGLPPR